MEAQEPPQQKAEEAKGAFGLRKGTLEGVMTCRKYRVLQFCNRAPLRYFWVL